MFDLDGVVIAAFFKLVVVDNYGVLGTVVAELLDFV
jgi:hypothetical protein